ncbi:MAG: agmatinase [Pseudomonadota bacterium]
MADDFRDDFAITANSLQSCTHREQIFSGALSFCRRRYVQELDGVDVAVVGVPLDLAVTNRPGARFGPRAIRAASSNLGWSRAWPSSFDPFERLSVADWGDVRLDTGRPGALTEQIAGAIAHVIGSDGGRGVLMLGGDHFSSYPSLQAHAERHGGPLALVQFDAHTDTWPDNGGRFDHGTMFASAIREGLIDPEHSIQVGIRTTNDDPMGVEVRDAITVQEAPLAETVAAIKARVGGRPVYLSFDIDCLDPAYAPGTGTPVCGGLTSYQALAILRGLAGINLVGMDVVEVAPAYDVSEITALAGATVALELLCLYAARTGG